MAFRNIYVKAYDKFPYHKLTGLHVLDYTGKIFYYENNLPSGFDSKYDIAFDCECEFGEWRKLNKVFKK